MNTKILQRFGETLKNRRKEIGISQEQLAEKLGIHRTYMSFLERGLRNPSLILLFKISRALKTNLSELFEFDKI